MEALLSQKEAFERREEDGVEGRVANMRGRSDHSRNRKPLRFRWIPYPANLEPRVSKSRIVTARSYLLSLC